MARKSPGHDKEPTYDFMRNQAQALRRFIIYYQKKINVKLRG